MSEAVAVLSQPLTLKCGLTLPNRLVKAAMAENLSNGGLPHKAFCLPYETWAKGGWGMLITGNVGIDQKYLGQPHDIFFDEAIGYTKALQSWKLWAKSCKSGGTPAIVQINHPGKQSPLGAGKRGFWEKNLAPSATPLQFGKGIVARAISSLVFGTPKEMTKDDIRDVVQRFANTARLAADAGFSGVEIHAAHGYLLAQFLSANTNKRTDEYGGSPQARARIVVEVINAVRNVVPKDFCVGLKLNSVDHQSQTELAACIDQLQLITDAGIDFLEVSGGSYEDRQLIAEPLKGHAPKSDKTKAREAFFLEFAEAVRQRFPETHLIVTGGFRTRKGMSQAVLDKGCDLVGIARPAVLDPLLAKDTILRMDDQEPDLSAGMPNVEPSWLVKLLGVRLLSAGTETAWYGDKLRQIGKN